MAAGHALHHRRTLSWLFRRQTRSWSHTRTNFNDKIVASGESIYLLSPEQIAEFTPLHDGYIAAVAALVAARSVGTRSAALVAARNTARNALLPAIRELYAIIQANRSVSDAAKTELGIKIPDREPTPPEPITEKPKLDVVRVEDRTGAGALARQHAARLGNSLGALVFTHVGENPPASVNDWMLASNLGSTRVDLPFPSHLPPGTKVWVTAAWYNTRRESGPLADPVTAYLGGGVSKTA